MFYRCVSLQMIIEFLYLKYTNLLLTQLLPSFAIQAFLFQALVLSFEGYYDVYKTSEFEQDGQIFYQYKPELFWYKFAAYTLLTLNILMSVKIIQFQYHLIKNMGVSYFKRFYSVVDIAYIIMTFMIFIICFF